MKVYFSGLILLCRYLGHSVVVINESGQFMRRIGSERVTCFPNGIDISDAGDVLIGDSHGNQFHVAVYDKDAQLVSQFVCPNVKVSRYVSISSNTSCNDGELLCHLTSGRDDMFFC